MKITRKVAIILSLFVLTSCATPYQKAGFMGGYEEKQIASGEYELYFYYNIYGMIFQNNLKNWEKRASELCGGTDGYVVTEGPETVMIPLAKHGKIKCKL